MASAQKENASFNLGLIYAALLLGFALRVYRLDYQSLWFDEANTVEVARQSLSGIIGRAYRPPLYHYLLHMWLMVAGASDFALRFLSTIFGVLMMPLVYAFGRQLFDRRTGAVAAWLVAISPALLWHSQEVRMYSLLATVYVLLIYLFQCLLRRPMQGHWRLWAALGLVEAIALYTHYSSFLAVAYMNLVALGWFGLRREIRALARWLTVQVAVALAYLPWLALVYGGFGGVSDYIEPGAPLFGPEAVRIQDFARQVWHFLSGGTMELIDQHIQFTFLSTLSAILLLIGVAILLVFDARRRSALWLSAHTLGPLGLAFVLFALRRGTLHPRHVLMISGPLLLVVARGVGLVWQSPSAEWMQARRARRAFALAVPITGSLLGLAYLATFSVALQAIIFDPRYQRPDVRAMVHTIEEGVSADDALIFPYKDYAFDHYYQGAASVHRLEMRIEDRRLIEWFSPLIADKRRAILVEWFQAPTDRRRFLPWLFEVNGRHTSRRIFSEFKVSTYELERLLSVPPLEPISTNFGVLELVGTFIEPTTPADEALPVALKWRLKRPTETDYKVSVCVEDEFGRAIAKTDAFLLDRGGWPTSRWSVGDEVTNYYVLDLPVGVPPLKYRLSVVVYSERTLQALDWLDQAGVAAGQSLVLGPVQVAPAPPSPGAAPLPAEFTPLYSEVATGLVLEGFAPEELEVAPGQRVRVALRWRAERGNLPAYQTHLYLRQGGSVLAEAEGAPADGRYPTSAWAAGERVLEWRDLLVPPDAPEGPAVVEIAVGDGPLSSLTRVLVQPRERLFTAPPMAYSIEARFGDFAELLGYDLSALETTAVQGIELTLYWRATNDWPLSTSFTVFTHLLNEEGRVVGQHDGLPANGAQPSTSWLKGEIIIDRHQMELKNKDFSGQASLEVGLYDLATGQRVPLTTGGDHLILPMKVTITPSS